MNVALWRARNIRPEVARAMDEEAAHPAEEMLRKLVDPGVRTRMAELEQQNATSATSLVEERTAKAALEERLRVESDAHAIARAEADERRLSAERVAAELQATREEAEAVRRAAQETADLREAAIAERDRLLEAERVSAEQARAEAMSVRSELEKARATPAPPPPIEKFSVDVRTDSVGVMLGLVLNIGDQKVEVDVRRDAAGLIRQLQLAQKKRGWFFN